uniref:Uncharacterized protein n=1 Tax=Arundo donax TaxID=35708 RepID=A0A0A8Z6V3_ARUDO
MLDHFIIVCLVLLHCLFACISQKH